MQRSDWKFEYTGKLLADAARAKVEYHGLRHKSWLDKKDQIIKTIRSEGLEVDERIAIQRGGTANARDWERGAQVMIRNDLQAGLDECLKKLAYHTEKLNAYNGWLQLLSVNPEAKLPLDHEDWLFFFGK